MELYFMIVESDGIPYYINIHQQDTGKPDLILLHGFMGSSRSFKFNIPLLNSFCNPVTIDLIGHGKTMGAQEVERFNLGRQLRDLHHIINQISKDTPYLHGYSMGGRLALRYTLKNPGTIGGLILESTNYGIDGNTKVRERQQVDEKRAMAIEKSFESFLEKWKELPLFKGKDALPKERFNHYQELQKQQKPEQMAMSLRGFGTAQMPSVKKKLDRLELPVLLLAGECDEKYTKIMAQMNQLLPQSTLSIIRGAGHRVHLNNPDAHASAIKKFITKL